MRTAPGASYGPDMGAHPNVTAVNEMTTAVVNQDRGALDRLFTDDFVFHLRGPFAKAGDHRGAEGLLDVIGTVFELTGGDVALEQRFCIGEDGWAAEWEHAVLGRNGSRLESDNAFVYRFDGGRIAEMWMFLGAAPEEAAAFFG
jgi:ketosteroid isomerase-like protein